MPLPTVLREAVEQELSSLDRSKVSRAAEQLTAEYLAGNFGRSLTTPEARAAYLATRLPATYAACESVFGEVARLEPDLSPMSLFDLGAGPGTASWAAAETWPTLSEFNLLEGNGNLAQAGHRLMEGSPRLQRAKWIVSDLRLVSELPSADIVVLSYVVGELRYLERLLSLCWSATRKMLVIVEPGTPRNFERLALIRQELIRLGGNVVAPCPHANECPMTGNDWCHFAVRLQRTAEHRRMKGGALGYEDEKFSYLAFAKQPLARTAARIVRHPVTHSGFIRLKLCTPNGLEEKTVTRSQRDAFRAARRVKWGDAWPQVE